MGAYFTEKECAALLKCVQIERLFHPKQ